MKIKSIVKVMNFHALLRVENAKNSKKNSWAMKKSLQILQMIF